MLLRLSRPILLIFLATLVCGIILGDLPGNTKLWQTLQDTAHAPAFALLSVVLLWLVRTRLQQRPSSVWSIYFICLTTSAVIGIAIEVIQFILHRDASGHDVATDMLGSIFGLAAYARFDGRVAHSRATKLTLSTAALLSIVVACIPLMWSVAAYMHRTRQFPVLAQFDSPFDLYFFSDRSSTINIQAMPPQPGSRTTVSRLHILFGKDAWPGVALDEPYADWTGYETLNVELSNPQNSSLSLNIRVHDKEHDQQMSDRFNMAFVVEQKSIIVLHLPLKAIQAAPLMRAMDLRHVAGITLFGDQQVVGKQLYLHKIWLE